MKSLILALAFLITTQAMADDSSVSRPALNARVFSSRDWKAGYLVADSGGDRGASVLFDGEKKPRKNLWIDELSASMDCDSGFDYRKGEAVDYTLTLSGNPTRGVVQECFRVTNVTVIGRVFTTDVYRIQFASKDLYLNRQFLRKL